MLAQKTWIYEMSNRTRNIRISRDLIMTCYKCGSSIEIGQQVYSKNSTSAKSKSHIYHIECARIVNLL